MSKKKFKVQAEVVTYVYIEIEADSIEEANDLAKEIDGGSYISTDDGDFRIIDELTEEIK